MRAETTTTPLGAARTRQRRRPLVSPTLLPYLLLAPAVLYLLGITLFPFLFALRSSVFETVVGIESFVGLEHYQRLFQDDEFWRSLYNTVLLASIALALEAVLAMGVALLVYRDPWVRAWRLIFILPMLFMPSAVAFMWKLLFFPGTSVVNDILIRLGLASEQIDWQGSTFAARAMLITVDVWQWTPFLFVIFVAGLQSMNEEIEEAAELDGARWHQAFWLITLPMLRPIIAIALTLRAIDLVALFAPVDVMTRGGPAGHTETVSYFIYRTAFKNFDQGYASAASVIVLVLTILAATLVVNRFFKSAS